MVAEVSVIESRSGCCLHGPCPLQVYVDYNFDPLSTGDQLATTSLGQFTMIDEAEDTAQRPLNEEMARKIVDFLLSAW